jgi:hypothetical protein
MREDQRRRALLGRLADLGWFVQSEVAATQALAVLLEEGRLRDALLGHLGQVTDRDLGAVAWFHPERVHDDRRRPDLEGHDSDGRPLVVVEAKFSARLSPDQVHAYLIDQEGKLGVDVPGALILLVPSYRKPEAEAVLRSVGGSADEQDAPTAISTTVVTWDEWLGLLDEAAEELPAAKQNAVRCDLAQLRELCKTMVAVDVPPLGPVSTGDEWKSREADLRRLVKQFTAQPQFRDASGKLLPVQHEPKLDFFFRYMLGGLPDSKCNCAVGVAFGLATEGGTPFWFELGIEPISEQVTPHSLRRAYASLRFAVGDDPVYVAEQLGHTKPTFSMEVYASAVKRRGRLSGAYLEEFDRGLEWASPRAPVSVPERRRERQSGIKAQEKARRADLRVPAER